VSNKEKRFEKKEWLIRLFSGVKRNVFWVPPARVHVWDVFQSQRYGDYRGSTHRDGRRPNLNCGATRRPFGLCVWGTARWPTLLRPNDSARYSVPGAVHSLSAALRQSAPTTPQVTVFNAIISGLKSFLCVTIMTGAVRY
jgi:hypothetical protein